MSKFDCPLAERLWELSMEGGEDEQTGDVSECGFWAGRFDNLTVEEADRPFAILIENDQGFVTVEQFDTFEECDVRWAELEGAYDESGDVDDDEGEVID